MQLLQCPICADNLDKRLFHYEGCPRFQYIDPANVRSRTINETYLFAPITVLTCGQCGYTRRLSTDKPLSEIYSTEALACVPVSDEMINRTSSLAAYLSEFVDQEATVADVGGGPGALSYALSARGFHVDLYEPSLSVETFNRNSVGRVALINSFFDPLHKQYDLIILKQVLEHVDDPGKMLREISSALREGGAMYLELPRFEWICQHNSIVDFHYQHLSYFSESSVEWFIGEAGFGIEDKRPLCDGHDIGYVCRKLSVVRKVRALPNKSLPHMQDINPEGFFEAFTKGQRLARLLENERIALYGANAYMQSFAGLFGRSLPQLKFVFDDSPVSHGKLAAIRGTIPYYVKITPTPLLGSDVLRSLSIIIICCYLHDEVVLRKLRSRGYGGRIYSLRPSSMYSDTELVSFFS